MPLFRLSLIVLLALPAALPAQRGYGRNAPPDLTTKDLEKLNPAKIALEQRKDLALSADQLGQLDSLAKALDLEAKNFGRAVDTLENIMRKAIRNLENDSRSNAMMKARRERPKSPKDSIERARSDSIDQANSDREQERFLTARNALGSNLLAIREAYDARLVTINALLTEDQRRKIGPWFEAASQELTTRLHWANARAP